MENLHQLELYPFAASLVLVLSHKSPSTGHLAVFYSNHAPIIVDTENSVAKPVWSTFMSQNSRRTLITSPMKGRTFVPMVSLHASHITIQKSPTFTTSGYSLDFGVISN